MFQKEFKIFGKSVNVSIRNDGDEAIAAELFLDHQYRHCDEVIRHAGQSIIDIGGHLGYFSLYANLLNNKVPIYTFEPHIGNYQVLKKNMKDNRVKNVFPKQLAVDGKIHEVDLLISKEDLNHSIVHAIEATNETQKVQTITLEKIINRHVIGHGGQNTGQVDLLKIDCEGAEFSIIEDSPVDIFDNVSHIFLEYHDWVPNGDHRRLKKFLEARGYKVEKYANSRMQELGFLWCYRNK